MSNLPAFAQGVQFCIDTSPDTDSTKSFYPHTPRSHQGSHQIVPQARGGFARRGGGNTPRGNFTPSHNFTPRGGHPGLTGPPNTPRHFHERRHGTPREDFGNSGNYTPRGSRAYHGGGASRSSQHWTPRQSQPNFNNPYENQLTPRQSYGPRNRWTHTPRGRVAPLSTEFGPCASGASKETLAIIDAFVKPSMLDNPWRHLEEQSGAGDKQDTAGPSLKKVRSDIKPDASPPPDEDEAEDEAGASENPNGSRQKVEARKEEGDDEDFNLRDFIPKV